MPKSSFDKQLDKTIKKGTQYTLYREKLKKMFCDKYDRVAINKLLYSLEKKGHPSEQKFAEQFKKHDTSNNYDKKEIEEFQRFFRKYKESIINDLENSLDGE